jgi:hypothetical protein
MENARPFNRHQAAMDAWYNLIEEENRKNSFVNKLFNATPEVNDTASWAAEYAKELIDGEEKKFRYSISYRIFMSCLAVTGFFFVSFLFYNMALHPASSLKGNAGPGPFFWLLPFSFVILAAREALSRACIVLNAEGIRLNKKRYLWQDVLGTYIVKRPGEKAGRKCFLVLTMQGGEVVRYNVDYYGRFWKELSAYIEMYKKRGAI